MPFLSSTQGVEYLMQFDILPKQLDRWFENGNTQYVIEIEELIEQSLNYSRSYGLNPPVPTTWILKDKDLSFLKRIPLSILIQLGAEVTVQHLDVIFEQKDQELYLAARCCQEVSHSTVSICVLLGKYCIDSRGAETSGPGWYNCTEQDRQAAYEQHLHNNFIFNKKKEKEIDAHITVNKEGALFIFHLSQGKWLLEKIQLICSFDTMANSKLEPPSHFCGEVVKTKQGAEILSKSGYIEKLIEHLNSNNSLQLRASIWAFGHIGQTEYGLQILLHHQILNRLCTLAVVSDVLSIRGTCLQALSLVSRTQEGRNELYKLEWHAKERIAVPMDHFFKLNLEAAENETEDWQEYDKINKIIQLNEEENDILENIINLSNIVLKQQSFDYLRTKRNSHCFNNPQLFLQTMNHMSFYKFKQQMRKAIYTLFDRNLNNKKFLNKMEKFVIG